MSKERKKEMMIKIGRIIGKKKKKKKKKGGSTNIQFQS